MDKYWQDQLLESIECIKISLKKLEDLSTKIDAINFDLNVIEEIVRNEIRKENRNGHATKGD